MFSPPRSIEITSLSRHLRMQRIHYRSEFAKKLPLFFFEFLFEFEQSQKQAARGQWPPLSRSGSNMVYYPKDISSASFYSAQCHVQEPTHGDTLCPGQPDFYGGLIKGVVDGFGRLV
jgi:hypothetical protein